MDAHELTQLLESVRRGQVAPAEAVGKIRTNPFEAAGEFATVDLHRGVRCGFPEVIFGQGKDPEQIEGILRVMLKHGQGGLVTRVEPAAAAQLASVFPEGEHNALGRTFRIRGPNDPGPKLGKVAIVTAGHERPARGRGGAGHGRGLELRGRAGGRRRRGRAAPAAAPAAGAGGADAVVVVAGMEGALPSVVGGLVDCPVIAVPTSIGYGASFGGLAALLGMLNSCASNVVVVNIDAGFNGGHVAGLIARRAGQARQSARGDAPSSGGTHGSGTHRNAPDAP